MTYRPSQVFTKDFTIMGASKTTSKVKIAVLSGKGGTGKTMVAVNLAAVVDHSLYLDCDIEAPNGHIFLKPQDMETSDIAVKVPLVDRSLCTDCRACVNFCHFNALAAVGGKIKVFDQVCHSCGGCQFICPHGAISEVDKVIGTLEVASKTVTGRLKLGEATGVPIIQAVLETGDRISGEDQPIMIDCPPGSACSVMESIKDADFCLLVAEPTRFGAHNLEMVHELVSLFNKPFGVVLNKTLPDSDNPSEAYCLDQGIEILGSIPFDYDLAHWGAHGLLAVIESKSYRLWFEVLYQKIQTKIAGGGPCN